MDIDSEFYEVLKQALDFCKTEELCEFMIEGLEEQQISDIAKDFIFRFISARKNQLLGGVCR